MAEALCLDASVFLKVYLPEPDSNLARDLVGQGLADGNILVGPAFLAAEVLSTLRRTVHRGAVSEADAATVVASFLSLPIEEVTGSQLYGRAWELARELDLPVVYDAVYLAVAEDREAEFWTADVRLYEKAKGSGYVRLLGS